MQPTLTDERPCVCCSCIWARYIIIYRATVYHVHHWHKAAVTLASTKFSYTFQMWSRFYISSPYAPL